MKRVILVDDEMLALVLLERVLADFPSMQVVGKFQRPLEALQFVQTAKEPIDIAFLDIEMPVKTGLQLASELQTIAPNLDVVFVTAYNEFAVQAFELNAMDYLMKPVTKDRIKKTIDRLVGQMETHISETTARIQSFRSFIMYDGEGSVVKWRTKKAKELFAYLWHFSGQAIWSEKIIEDLWPDFTPEKGKTMLHSTIYQIRSTLKQLGYFNAIEFADEKYRLLIDIPSDRDHWEKTLQSAEKLLAIYQGHYMETDDFDWIQQERYQLETDVVKALQQLLKKEANVAALQKLHELTYIDEEERGQLFERWSHDLLFIDRLNQLEE